MDLQIYDQIYKELSEYVAVHSAYSPSFHKGIPPKKPVYPIVVFSEIDNSYKGSAFNNIETRATLVYEVDIYAETKVYNGVPVSSIQIAREVQGWVDDFMSRIIKLRRNFARPAPNIDTTLYRVVLRYTTSLDEYRRVTY